MALRRVTVPGESSFSQAIQDSVSRLARDIDENLIDSYGIPTKVITTDYRPRFGELVRLDMRDNPLTVTLPRGDKGKVGKTITIANVTTGINQLTMRAANGSLNGETQVVIEKGYFVRQAAYLGADVSGNDLWLLTTVLDGSTSAGIAPFFEWNETDLSQFGTLQAASGNSQSASVVSSLGLNWVQISGNCTGTANFGGTIAFLPVSSVTPPSDAYIVMADCLAITTSANLITMGVGIRHSSGTGSGNGYFMGMVSTAGTATGNTLCSDITGTTATGLYSFTTNEGLNVNQGNRFAIATEGNTHLQLFGAKNVTIKDTGATHTGAGDFGLYSGGNNTGTQTYTAQFRNIRAYDWPNDGLFF